MAQDNGIAAVGTVSGSLTASGTVRNIVMQVTLPLDIEASRARVNTDAALAQSSCDALHVELGGASVNVLGSTMGLNPVAFDIGLSASDWQHAEAGQRGCTDRRNSDAIGNRYHVTVREHDSAGNGRAADARSHDRDASSDGRANVARLTVVLSRSLSRRQQSRETCTTAQRDSDRAWNHSRLIVARERRRWRFQIASATPAPWRPGFAGRPVPAGGWMASAAA